MLTACEKEQPPLVICIYLGPCFGHMYATTTSEIFVFCLCLLLDPAGKRGMWPGQTVWVRVCLGDAESSSLGRLEVITHNAS